MLLIYQKKRHVLVKSLEKSCSELAVSMDIQDNEIIR
jgi:hypothetical protein